MERKIKHIKTNLKFFISLFIVLFFIIILFLNCYLEAVWNAQNSDGRLIISAIMQFQDCYFEHNKKWTVRLIDEFNQCNLFIPKERLSQYKISIIPQDNDLIVIIKSTKYPYLIWRSSFKEFFTNPKWKIERGLKINSNVKFFSNRYKYMLFNLFYNQKLLN